MRPIYERDLKVPGYGKAERVAVRLYQYQDNPKRFRFSLESGSGHLAIFPGGGVNSIDIEVVL